MSPTGQRLTQIAFHSLVAVEYQSANGNRRIYDLVYFSVRSMVAENPLRYDSDMVACTLAFSTTVGNTESHLKATKVLVQYL